MNEQLKQAMGEVLAGTLSISAAAKKHNVNKGSLSKALKRLKERRNMATGVDSGTATIATVAPVEKSEGVTVATDILSEKTIDQNGNESEMVFELPCSESKDLEKLQTDFAELRRKLTEAERMNDEIRVEYGDRPEKHTLGLGSCPLPSTGNKRPKGTLPVCRVCQLQCFNCQKNILKLIKKLTTKNSLLKQELDTLVNTPVQQKIAELEKKIFGLQQELMGHPHFPPRRDGTPCDIGDWRTRAELKQRGYDSCMTRQHMGIVNADYNKPDKPAPEKQPGKVEGKRIF